MAFTTIFKFKSKSSKAKKLSLSAPVAVTVLQIPTSADQTELTSVSSGTEPTSLNASATAPKSPNPSAMDSEEPAPTELEIVLNDPAALQEITGNQTYHDAVNTNNTLLTNSNNDGVDNENCTITGDHMIYCGNLPATLDAGTPPILLTNGRRRHCFNITYNDQVKQFYLDDDEPGDGGNKPVAINGDFLAKVEKVLIAEGIYGVNLREYMLMVQQALQLVGPAIQKQVQDQLAQAAAAAHAT